MNIRFIIASILGSLFSILLSGCGSRYSSRASEFVNTTEEVVLCDQEQTYVGGLSLTGKASFYKRSVEMITELDTNGIQQLKNMMLGDPVSTPLPIRFAEVAVYDSNNNLVQCGKTNAAGEIKNLNLSANLILPAGSGSYKVRVLARTNHQIGSQPIDLLSVSVKKDIYTNQVYAIQATIDSNGSQLTAANPVAYARQSESLEIEGGAFNILNNIQIAYDYIKTNTSSVNTSCLSDKLNVYWKAGFNPMQYLDPEADPVTLSNTSFYSQTLDQLFISGGQLGDMSLSNTDHFDDFATIHELGHFIEKHCGQYTSAGGSHNLIFRIDPRLAWSEGWSNYFATQVIKSKIASLDSTLATKLTNVGETNGWTFFFNSFGFSDSVQNISNGNGFIIDFKKSGSNPGSYTFAPYTGKEFDVVRPGFYPSEGHTREGAISRGLYKLANDCGASCTPINFSEIWKAFDRITGVAEPNVVTPYISSFNIIQKMKLNGVAFNTSHDNTLNSEALSSDYSLAPATTSWPGFGRKLGLGTCSLSIEPRTDDVSLTGSNSDQRYSNHFYSIDLSSLSGLTQISVLFTYATGTAVDHDLILFKPGYYFNDDYYCTAADSSGNCSGVWASQRTVTEDIIRYDRSSQNLSAPYTKTISNLNTLDSSNIYLLNIRAYTPNINVNGATVYNYTINSNLGQLCPQ